MVHKIERQEIKMQESLCTFRINEINISASLFANSPNILTNHH